MVDIRLDLHIDASPNDAFAAVATRHGVTRWWTPTVSGECGLGETFRARFEDGWSVQRVRRWVAGNLVEWLVVDGDRDEWAGTRIVFSFEPDGDSTLLRFIHEGWPARTPYFDQCADVWDGVLRRLKAAAETREPGARAGARQTVHMESEAS